jgi:hypothetical protein
VDKNVLVEHKTVLRHPQSIHGPRHWELYDIRYRVVYIITSSMGYFWCSAQTHSAGGDEPDAEPERDAAQFLVFVPKYLHVDRVRALQRSRISKCISAWTKSTNTNSIWCVRGIRYAIYQVLRKYNKGIWDFLNRIKCVMLVVQKSHRWSESW